MIGFLGDIRKQNYHSDMVVPPRSIAPIYDFYLQKMGKVVRKRVALPGKLFA